MWRYEKRLQYPVKISQPNPKMAQFIMSQYRRTFLCMGEQCLFQRCYSEQGMVAFTVASLLINCIKPNGKPQTGRVGLTCET